MHRALTLFLLAMLAACGRAPPIDPTNVRPAMWQVEDADTRLVILGSVHQLPADLDWMRGRVAEEVARADEAILELSPDELARAPALFARNSRDEPVTSLRTRFDTAIAARADDLVDGAESSASDAEGLESWALALAIGHRLAADAGLSSANGVEARITAAFSANGRQIGGLETAAAQLAMFDTLPTSVQEAMVAAAVADAATAPARTRRLLAAWARGDVAGLTAAADEAMADTPQLIEPVIHARNRAWAAALQARLARPGRVLVAVGAGHLVGPQSLLAELERRGLTVTRLQ